MGETRQIAPNTDPSQGPDPRDPEAFYAALPAELETDYLGETAILAQHEAEIQALAEAVADEAAGSPAYQSLSKGNGSHHPH